MLYQIYYSTVLILVHLRQHRSDQVEYDLIHGLLKDYDYSIRPSPSYHGSINVTFGLALTQIIDIVRMKNLNRKRFYEIVHFS
jgi:hypothetical protein